MPEAAIWAQRLTQISECAWPWLLEIGRNEDDELTLSVND
jgi:hypothetical protein